MSVRYNIVQQVSGKTSFRKTFNPNEKNMYTYTYTYTYIPEIMEPRGKAHKLPMF